MLMGIVSLLFGGGGGFAGAQLFGGDQAQEHEELATKAQIDALTAALSLSNERIARLEAGLTSHDKAPAHTEAIRRIVAVERDVSIANKVIEVYHQK